MARRRRSLLSCLLLVLTLGAVGCRADTTRIAAPNGTTSPTAAPTEQSDGAGSTPTTAPPPSPTPAPAGETPVPSPTPVGPPPAAAPVTLDWFLAFDPTGAYGYEAIGNPWQQERDCDGAPEEAVTGIDIAASQADDLIGFVTGVQVVGAAEQLVFGPDGTGVLLSSCGEYPGEVVTLTIVRVGEWGRLVAQGPGAVVAKQPDDHGLWMTGVDGGAALIEVTVGADDDDPAGWTRELRRVDLSSGAIEVVESVSLENAFAALPGPIVESPDGRYRYRQIPDPAAGFGCEGFGVAASIGIDRGDGFEPVWGLDQPAYSNVLDLHFGPDDLVAWTSSCEGFGSIIVGRVVDDGTIVDHHHLETFEESSEGFVEYRHFRLTSEGQVVALGQRVDADYRNPIPAMRRIRLDDDPGFVATGANPPWIDTANPLVPTLAGTGDWYVGEFETGSGRCGGRTLYASTSAGFVRAFSPIDGIDHVVDLVVSEERLIEYGDGVDTRPFRTRAVVALTECPERYDGLRLWFGEEEAVPAFGIHLVRADLPEVAGVLSVRQQVPPGQTFRADSYAEVLHRDGSIEQVLLVPADGG